eukprot:Gregarina_sp_Poly_1__11268@NODE_933_length_5670_cov_66_873461_g662_i0_p1_GENE_NODE_933_length_5670_cov_66_873461_g662_i0NODE_933_length_5670_cov_66_873461_g662_i0_p1_ORF_typecomplete_len1256_score303_47MAD/PF05557_13/0_064MAD/PF05557_13/8_2e06Myosin_tail_1/PF01576_19/0_069Myosin_tail_1/PF01576_19/0_019Myosin_tail_1/PF01576_19/0_22CALCOCO1/PF07888_11/0_75CALCOCO1/PF07888_11/0_045CALCOCO1/PF07888_11/1_1e02CALCOCO1/PF07888_11/0_013HOOK/PF05622_12/0_17HOOK/PF05622_12/0_0037HOOK/PF05622_12/26KASH_CCD
MFEDPQIMRGVLQKIVSLLNDDMNAKIRLILRSLVEDEVNLLRLTEKYEAAAAQNDEQHEEINNLNRLVTTLQSKVAETSTEIHRLRELAGEIKEVKTQLEEAEAAKEVEVERVRKETRKATIHMVKMGQGIPGGLKYGKSDTGLDTARSGKSERDSDDDAMGMDEAEAVLAQLGGGRRTRKSVALNEPPEEKSRAPLKKADYKALQTQLAQMTEEKEKLANDLQNAESVRRQKESEIAGLKDEILMLTTKNLEMSEVESERKTLVAEVEQKESAIRQMIEEMGQLEDQVGELISEKKKLLRQIEASAKEIQVLKSELTQAGEPGAPSPVELREMEVKLEKALEESHALQELVTELERAREVIEENLQETRLKHDEAVSEVVALQHRLNGAEATLERMADLIARESELQSELETVKSTIQMQSDALAEARQRALQFERAAAEADKRVSGSQEEAAALSGHNKSLKTQMRAIARDLEALRQCVRDRDAQISAMRSEFESPDREEIRRIAELMAEVETLTNELDDCRMDLLTSETLVEQLRTALNEARGTIEEQKQIKRDLEPIFLPPNPQHQGELTRARHVIAQLKARVQSLQRQMEFLRQQRTSVCQSLIGACRPPRRTPRGVSPSPASLTPSPRVTAPSPPYLYPVRNALGFSERPPQPPKRLSQSNTPASHVSHTPASHVSRTPLTASPSLQDLFVTPGTSFETAVVHAGVAPRVRLPQRSGQNGSGKTISPSSACSPSPPNIFSPALERSPSLDRSPSPLAPPPQCSAPAQQLSDSVRSTPDPINRSSNLTQKSQQNYPLRPISVTPQPVSPDAQSPSPGWKCLKPSRQFSSPFPALRSPSRQSPMSVQRSSTFSQQSPTSAPPQSPSHARPQSPSPTRRQSPSPARHQSPSPARNSSPSPAHRQPLSTACHKSPSPTLHQSPSPARRQSPSPTSHQSQPPSPDRHQSPPPGRHRSPSPALRQSPSPVRQQSPSPGLHPSAVNGQLRLVNLQLPFTRSSTRRRSQTSNISRTPRFLVPSPRCMVPPQYMLSPNHLSAPRCFSSLRRKSPVSPRRQPRISRANTSTIILSAR